VHRKTTFFGAGVRFIAHSGAASSLQIWQIDIVTLHKSESAVEANPHGPSEPAPASSAISQ
jgi:hypothetical protein